jgi:hypothetical protein
MAPAAVLADGPEETATDTLRLELALVPPADCTSDWMRLRSAACCARPVLRKVGGGADACEVEDADVAVTVAAEGVGAGS